jgi:hypothetical protein
MNTLATFARAYVSNIEQGIALFRRHPTERPRLRFSHASGLELALVGDVLILAGPQDVIDGFRSTQVTVIVDDLDQAIEDARRLGGDLLRPPAPQQTGTNATVSFPFGAVVEYVQWTSPIRHSVGV